MPGPLDKLCGPGKPLQIEAPDTNEVAGLLPRRQLLMR